MKSYPPKSKKSSGSSKQKPFSRNRTIEKRLPPTLNSMIELLKRSEIKLNKEQIHQLWTFHNLLRARNTDQELTRIIGFEPIIIKHYVDCMIVGKFLELP
ncbi:MAG: hypothetical protein ACKOA8_07100, partial [Deltaproteobacteria bacterium]